MASFKAHISFGILTAVVLTGVLFYLSMVSGFPTLLVFILTIIGSMLPDIDSDTGIPVRILFFVLSLGAAVSVLFYMDTSFNTSIIERGLISIGSGLFTYFIVGSIFRRLTEHRGIFHSVPATLAFGLGAISLADIYGFDSKTSVSIGLAISSGYLCHLILDELNSTVNLSGVPFVPKKSLGTALQLWANSTITSTLIYLILIILLVLNFNILTSVI